jgi:ADP-heptose:LPS heptosyltransferase
MRRVLAVRLDGLGNLLMSTPALFALRASLPGARITLLTSLSNAVAAPHLSMVDRLWTSAVPWMPGECGAPGAIERELVARLRDEFDAAVIFTGCAQSALPAALLCRLAGIPLRLAHSRENPYGLLTDWISDPDRVVRGNSRDEFIGGARHETRRQLDLLAAVGMRSDDERLHFTVSDSHRREVQGGLRAAGFGARPFVLLHLGANATSRRWPAARFGLVAQGLAASGTAAILCAGPGEQHLLDDAMHAASRMCGSADVAGLPAPLAVWRKPMALGTLAALIEAASVLVGNNSAPAHLAAAVGTPVVSLYALTHPQHTPWQVARRVLQEDVPCRGCLKNVCPEGHHLCLRAITSATVLRAACELLHPIEAEIAE